MESLGALLGTARIDGRDRPQLVLQQRTLNGMETITITEMGRDDYDTDWACVHDGVRPPTVTPFIFDAIPEFIVKAQKTTSSDPRYATLKRFLEPLGVYASQVLRGMN